ncbi:MFS transporter [Sphingomonas sp. BIUV-7]|uniref:MFS transporter n=1 Tax=Sphingomonas natans TaxID=3063330 RepID=A0ABT8Y817_9SPHN|nr:MFS transporter [Sphingomonas sp. BIUV-7]MDO6414460.1 MFS transporter [Sphingomonas sp. BIUV-7]
MTASARQEWAAGWPLPLLGMFGIAGAATMGYSSGVFMSAMVSEFHWSRAQFSSAFTVQMIVGLVVGPYVGRVIDKVGPRRVALFGVLAFLPGFSVLGLANGVPWQWWLLGVVQAVCTTAIGPPTWLAAITPRFNVSRGLALSVALAGVGVGTAIWPVLAAFLVEHIGWRATFPALACIWGVVMVPATFLFFKDRPTPAGSGLPAVAEPIVPSAPGQYWRALRSRSFVFIALAGGLYVSMSYAMILHAVPLLQAGGLTLGAAARLAGIAGLCSIIGRLCTGVLLDRFPARSIAIVVFLLPFVVSLLLRFGAGSWEASLAAVILLGLSAGAETDVVVYTASRRFDRAVMASLFATIFALFSVFAAAGPLLASALFDATKSYDGFLMLVGPVVLVATILMAVMLSPRAQPAVAL